LGETSKLKERISDLTSDRTDLSDRKDLISVLKNTELQALEKISGQFESNKALLDKLKEDYRQMLLAADRYDDDIAEIRREEEAQNKKILEYTAARESRHSQKVECEDRLKAFEDEKTAAVIRSSEIQKDIENARALLEVSMERIRVCEEDINAAKARIDSYRAQIDNITVAQAENRKRYDEVQCELDKLNAKRAEVEEGNLEFDKKLADINSMMRDKMAEKEMIFRVHTTNSSRLENLREKYDRLASRLWDDYELTRADAMSLDYPPVTEENRAEVAKQQTECQNKLRHIGSVDLDAVNMGYISITPMTWSRTDMNVFKKLK
jgi:chromosome segregation protein